MKSIGKYRVLAEWGSSAAGKLYRARDTFRNREVALKVYDSAAAPNPEAKDQFCRELGACADLRHPHIAAIVDVGEADGVIYLASELLAGNDLRRHFQDHRLLPLNTKLELMAQVCDGLALAHRRGIAHGNLKPRNLLLPSAGDIRILDFGSGRWIASILGAGGRLPSLSIHHFAPEQILGEFFDTRADIFSIGLILYQLLVDKYPFPVPDAVVPREIVHTEPEPLRKSDPQIPEELEQLVARALHKDPQQRLRTADQFADALRHIAQQDAPKPAPLVAKLELPAAIPELVQPPIPQPTAKPATTPKRTSLRKRVLTYTAAAILALGITGTFLSRKGVDASPTPGPAPAPVTQSQPVEAPAKPAPPPAEPAAAAVVNPQPAQPSEEQAQLHSVKSLWESGNYTPAMRLVNEILAKNPDSAAARSWKKKIRDAQIAEAEIK
ncbi:MAG TPA: protein kinase [Bryobacteraceae bacterium]|nr:protein kinase [Bryobacteraceae bacterium]